MIKRLFPAVCCALAVFGLPLAAVHAAEIKTATDLNLVIATTREAKLKIVETVNAGDTLQFKLGGDVSPVSVNATFDAAFTPVPFLQFLAAGSVGTGWNIPIANGLRMVERDGAHDAELTGGAFSGLVWSAEAGGVFQFDLAAVKPGEWNHVVFQTTHIARYRGLSSAGAAETWLYEADTGENRNGWNYYGSYFLGYRMPLILNTAGFLVEEDLYLFDTEDRALWGDDMPRWTFGPLFNFTVNKRTSAAILLQWHTMRDFTAETEDYGFYQDRRIAESDQYRIEFYRAALSVTVKLR